MPLLDAFRPCHVDARQGQARRRVGHALQAVQGVHPLRQNGIWQRVHSRGGQVQLGGEKWYVVLVSLIQFITHSIYCDNFPIRLLLIDTVRTSFIRTQFFLKFC